MNDLKERRKEIFADTQKFYKSNAKLAESIKNWKSRQRVISEGEVMCSNEVGRYDDR